MRHGGPKPWLGVTQPFPLSCQGSSVSFLDAFGRGEGKRGVSPPGIVLSVDVTEKNDGPHLCERKSVGILKDM